MKKYKVIIGKEFFGNNKTKLEFNSSKEVLELLANKDYSDYYVEVVKIYPNGKLFKVFINPWNEDNMRSVDSCTNWELVIRLLNTFSDEDKDS